MKKISNLRRFLPLFLTFGLCFSSVSSVSAAEETAAAEEPSAEERLEPDAYFEPIQSNEIADWPQGPAVWAESAAVLDVDSGAFLYSKNIDASKYPASITKIMTTLLAIENAGPDERVTFSEHAIYGIERNSSHIGIRVGEILSLKDCWYGMMLESANEVCLAVAEHIGGSVEGFVDLMNQKAAELGCTGTHFTNPNGLPDENHYTTAHDMALIAQAAYKNPTFRKVSQTCTYRIPTTNICGEERWLSNHHKMLPDRLYTYSGCTGGKTGFTQAALNTLVTFAERDGRRLVCVSLRTNGPQIYTDTASMLNYGFDNFQNIAWYSRKTNPAADSMYPSLYLGAPTLERLRLSCTVTIPASASREQISEFIAVNEPITSHTYSFHHQQVGYEEVNDSAFRALLKTAPSTIARTPSVYAAFRTIPIYVVIPAILLVLLIVLYLLLLQRRHRNRRKRRRKRKKKN